MSKQIINEINKLIADAKAGKSISPKVMGEIENIANDLSRVKDKKREKPMLDMVSKIEKLISDNKLRGQQNQEFVKSIVSAINAIKIETPVNVKVPDVKIPEIKVPEVNIDIPEIKLPDIKVEVPEIKIPKIVIPEPKPVKPPIVNIPSTMKVSKPTWLSSITTPINKQLMDVKKLIKDFKLPSRAGKPVSVRLSDGDKFYRALGGGISGGSAPPLVESGFGGIGVQNPLPTDGDSIYFKDLDLPNCTVSGFTFDVGDGSETDIIKSIVSDVFVGKSNDSSDNPKTIYLQFKRPVLTESFGINSAPGKYFSNTKIVLGQGEHSWVVHDDSADNTQHQIFLFPIEPVKFSSMEITFNTVNEIGVGLVGIFKNQEVVASIRLQKPDKSMTYMQGTTKGNAKFSLEEFDETFYNAPLPVASFKLLVAKGLATGHSTVHKYGRGANIDTADGYVDIWDGAEYDNTLKTYTFSTTADIDRLSSSDSGDTQDVVVEGLDSNWDLVSQTITLTGQTPVALTTSLIRVFRMYNNGTTDFAGHIFCFVNVATTAGVPDTLTNTRALINDGNNQTLMSIYTIPNGKTGYVENWYGVLSGSKAGLCDLKMRARPFGSVFRLKHTSTLDSNGNSYIQHDFEYPQKMPAKTDMIMSANSSVNDNAVSSGFEILLVDD